MVRPMPGPSAGPVDGDSRRRFGAGRPAIQRATAG